MAGVLTVGSVAGAAALKPASVFADNMVLQQKQDIPVWGRGTPGATVTVAFLGQRVSTTVSDDGRWSLRLSAETASAENRALSLAVRQVSAESAEETIIFQNVAVGEVWICSGQSNMGWPVCDSLNPEMEVTSANFPGIRLFTVREMTAPEPQEFCEGRWLVCSPSSVGTFSGVGYFFARRIHQELDVPVGMIHASWGGSPIVPWTPLETLKATQAAGDTARKFEMERDIYLADASQYDAILAEAVKQREVDLAAYDARVFAQDVGHVEGWANGNEGTGAWQNADMPLSVQVLGSFCGSAWCKRTVTIPGSWLGRELQFNFGSIDEADEVYVNGTLIGETHDNSLWQTPRHYTIPAAVVTGPELLVVARVMNQVGVMGVGGIDTDFSLLPVDAAEGDAVVPMALGWRYAFGSPLSFSDRPVIPMPTVPGAGWNASTIYNAMIAPLVPYGVRGALWYQGEADSGAWQAYEELLPAMIGGWRKAWGQENFDFLIVQLANLYAAQSAAIETASVADIRDVQRKTLAVPGTGLAVALDVGDPDDVHYPNKQDVGLRLAQWALNRSYGRADVVPSGPLYRSMGVDSNRVVLAFDHVADGLILKGAAWSGFAVAGEDHYFHKARAEIRAETVVVWADAVQEPVAVRYGWGNNPACTLYNQAGLPASSFRTDNWTHALSAD